MMNTSVLSHVAPNIRKQLRESACLILGTDLMWLICSSVADEYIPSDFKRVFFLEWEHVSSPGFDAKLNPNKNVVVTVLGDHGAVFIDIFGTVGVGRIAEQMEGGPGTNNVTMQNQFLLGIQSGLLALPQDKQLRDEDSNTCSNQVESGAMRWYTEWEHQANLLATCEATDCWRKERGHRRSSGATWKSCSHTLAMMAKLTPTAAKKSSQPLA
jgi:hypothetical protein